MPMALGVLPAGVAGPRACVYHTQTRCLTAQRIQRPIRAAPKDVSMDAVDLEQEGDIKKLINYVQELQDK